MTVQLPEPVAAYFTADTADADALARCFTADASVKDEGQTYRGTSEIRRWKAATSKKYTYTSEPFACETRDGNTVVTSRLTGSFPGSPVDLRFLFRLEGNRIASLEIIP